VIVFLHTNDLHGQLTDALAARLAELRVDADLFVDTGDAIKAGNLAVPLAPERAWPRLRMAGCDLGTLGNRESHPIEAAFRAKLAGLGHEILCANLRRKDTGELVFSASTVREIQGVRVGFVAAMVPIVTARMATAPASAYLWDSPIPAIADAARALRPEVDLLVALTHIGLRQDRALAEACPEIDVIFGGHSHDVLEEPVRVGSAWVVQGGSHARFVGRWAWDPSTRVLSGRLIPLKSDETLESVRRHTDDGS